MTEDLSAFLHFWRVQNQGEKEEKWTICLALDVGKHRGAVLLSEHKGRSHHHTVSVT